MRKWTYRNGLIKELSALVIPIVIQNLISNFINFADTVMLGRVSQTALSAGSLANQIYFILAIVYFGLASSITILSSKYWSRKDYQTIGSIFGIGLLISAAFSIPVAIVSFLIPETVLLFWTNDPLLIQEGASYLRIVSFSYLCMTISQPYLSIMKSCERVRLSTRISVIALVINVTGNAILIFGLFGLPAFGIKGAAIATCIARFTELLICGRDYLKQNILSHDPRSFFQIPKELRHDFNRHCMPAFLNDLLWGFAFNMNSVIMGHLGSDMVAASSVVSIVREILTVVGFSIASGSAILLGKEIGEGDLELARKDASEILHLTVLVSLIQAGVLYAVSGFIPGLVVLSETAKGYLLYMLKISCLYTIGQVINTLLIASFFRCGGDSKYGMRLDMVSMWGFAVPIGLLSAFVLHLPPLTVYTLLCLDEAVKLPFALYHYKQGNWINDLTRTAFAE
ncbi:MAG: MATE family efflux transporter [Solobacterium sp.]|nr:MATE family efflux transporter [Solobacterium sp.]